MTRYSISTALVTLLVGLVLANNALAISADGPCDVDSEGNCAVLTVTPSDVAIVSTSASNKATGTRQDVTERQVIAFDALTAIGQGTAYDDRLTRPQTSCLMVPAPCEVP